jgi:hypothetical protein
MQGSGVMSSPVMGVTMGENLVSGGGARPMRRDPFWRVQTSRPRIVDEDQGAGA